LAANRQLKITFSAWAAHNKSLLSMKRIPSAELLDTDAGTPQEVAASLADLRWFNRWFGGQHTTLRMLEQVVRTTHAKSLSLLEVAAGSGYVAHATKDHLATRGIELSITLLDRIASHVGNGGRSVVGDALALPFRDSSFDLVSCCLFAHHLSPEELVQFVKQGLRVCRKAVLINDLIRNPAHWALAYAGTPLYRSRITRNDAPASVRQAYTRQEMLEILRKTCAASVEIDTYYLFRMGAIAWKP
jgi:ubiquinone/menaquinone biosynthesis C-methylase UbiE